MECLENVIGIAKNDCPCLPAVLELSEWVSAGQWVIGDDELCIGQLGTPISISNTISVKKGVTYKVSFETDNVVLFEYNSDGDSEIPAGKHEYYITAESDTIKLIFRNQFNQAVCISNFIKKDDPPISGKYIDGGNGISLTAIKDTAKCRTMIDTMKEIRSLSIDEFLTAFKMQLRNKSKKHSHRMYLIGDYKKGNNPLVIDQFAVADFTPKHSFRGGVFTINSIELRFHGNATDTIPVWIYGNDELLASDTIDIVSGKGKLDRKFNFDLVDEYGNAINFRIVYDRKNNYPLDYKWNCGCGSSSRSWMSQFVMNSGTTSNFDEVTDIYCNKIHNMGMQISASTDCDPLKFICDLQFDGHDYGAILADTILLTARKNLWKHVLESNKLTIWSFKAPEIKEMIAALNSEILWRLQWLAQEYSYEYSECFICAGNNSSQMMTIDI